ncbi:hypothetical protein B0H17DRAFT_944826 [Mycena rosella]|uniref:Zn(2)-C6 fungal-type domain-containing protein n=1 Tax=Mycena rosella TaxID=1033263 RepID=A0AAD7D4A3_MYCRO|nr:hypothetical protein B0H17DRAFT_944826 [Mycena rosella]
MSRIDTSSQYSRRDPQLNSAQPVSATSLDLSPDSEAWSPTQSSRPRKSRREKPRIELAPDQPPTTQGKPRARVYVACIQCRTRKIRCDGAKPICHNCGKRASGGSDCNYDPLPKRRGPDKTPGARQRAARKMSEGGGRSRRRNNSSGTHEHSPDENGAQLPPFSFPSPSSSEQSPEEYLISPHEARISQPYISACACHGLSQCPSPPAPALLEHAIPTSQISVPYDGSLNLLMASPVEAPVSRGAYITELDENGGERRRKATPIASQPSLNFSRKIWWDSLLALYLSPNSVRLDSLSASQRDLGTQRITSDLRFLFRASNYWFSFLHAPTFFSNFYDPSKREQVQPSLVLAVLAMSTFWQSSEIGMGHHGRQRALTFRDEAQSALEASYNAGWVDDSLAQAAWILALFEVCAHPNHSTGRSASAMIRLDSIIRALSLTMVDVNDPSTSTFLPGKVPAVTSAPSSPLSALDPMQNGQNGHHNYRHHSSIPVSTDRGCSCHTLTLGEQWTPAFEHTPLWTQTPAWSASWSEAEVRKESCRRLCWSAMILAAGHSSYCFASRSHSLDLFISDPSNYALLFSGEAVSHSPSAKDTIWALHDRAFLLWLACIKMRNDTSAPVADKGQFAVKAWLEADAIEQAFNRHTCGIERAFVYQGREYIFNTRMCITYEFQRFVPLVSANVNGLFHRHKAEEWLSHQANVAQQFMGGLHTITGNARNSLSQRPFYVFWFMAQVSRGLTLWECDNSMTVALDVCKNLLAPIDYLTALWPCEEQRYRYESLRERLRDACDIAGVAPPPPLNLTLPPPVDDFL